MNSLKPKKIQDINTDAEECSICMMSFRDKNENNEESGIVLEDDRVIQLACHQNHVLHY